MVLCYSSLRKLKTVKFYLYISVSFIKEKNMKFKTEGGCMIVTYNTHVLPLKNFNFNASIFADLTNLVFWRSDWKCPLHKSWAKMQQPSFYSQYFFHDAKFWTFWIIILIWTTKYLPQISSPERTQRVQLPIFKVQTCMTSLLLLTSTFRKT